MEQARRTLEEQLARTVSESNARNDQVQRLTRDRDQVWQSPERRLGDLLLNRSRLRRVIDWTARTLTSVGQSANQARLGWERRATERGRTRVVATICSNFPIYSQTFVHQELSQLLKVGPALRIIYSQRDPREQLGPQFDHLWSLKRRLFLNRRKHQRDLEHYRERMPDRFGTLVSKLCDASGLSRDNLMSHDNFLQAFTFTRMVEAYQPEYLHSYFFYDRSLMALVAAYLLQIPRGVTSYADHELKDYELKVVGLHVELADLVVATSARIKRELIAIAPAANPEKIIVKPNGVDTSSFSVMARSEPGEGVYRVVSVCRIEPKKGLIYLVEAIGILRDRGVRVEAHFVGAADEWSPASVACKQELDRRISELNLWGTVHLEGRQNADSVRRFLSISQLFVAPFIETESGDKDGIPTALLEGMATGLPAVATDSGSITEVITEGVDGLIVPQRDGLALANAIETLLLDPDRRAQFAVAAAAKVRREFDAATCEQVFHDRMREITRARRA
ncbi:MAG: glycosyltransferase [bacterium]